MNAGAKLGDVCARRARTVTVLMVLATLVVGGLAAVPSVWELVLGREPLPVLNAVAVDTDPENMLSEDEAVRVFHDEMKEILGLYDMVVVGIVNEDHPDGVFNPESLGRIYELTQHAKENVEGLIEVDLIAPSTVDNIEQGGVGVVKFEWLMRTPPETPEEARAIRDKALDIPFLNDTLVSEDGQAIALYLPLERKDLSHAAYVTLREKIATFDGEDKFYITGLPVAEDVFGVEMFVQMAISAPSAMAVIFLLMLLFFRKLVLVISPMIIAMVSVILTMGALIIVGFPIHIMSSMIPIFIMPIAVLDAVHILSEFFDRYQETRDRKQTIVKVVDELFMPMLYTSLTSAAGFASLALTPIPPVQVFGVFVALGILLAWLLTVTFMPAYVMFIPARTLENFGARHATAEDEQAHGVLGRALGWLGGLTYRQAKPILALTVVVLVVAGYGISLIRINDNPVKWFTEDHPIRVADRVLNDHFAGTYMAYLALEAPDEQYDAEEFISGFEQRADQKAEELAEELPNAPQVFDEMKEIAASQAPQAETRDAALRAIAEQVQQKYDEADADTEFAWDEASLFVDAERQRSEIFKDPEVLRYISSLEDAMAATGIVGKSNSLSDIVKTVHRELLSGKEEDFRIPDSPPAVAQCLVQFQNSHRPDDLWHFVTPDYRTSSLWVQLSSGDNRNMKQVEEAVAAFVRDNPPPAGLHHEWFGLTYINVVWQAKMVTGMLEAFAGSFLVVFLLMTILFRSALWGLLSMVPLTVTIVAIYGAVGLVGKSYDMPVAVLSSLSLGLAIDFAIHFLARSRRYYEQLDGDWQHTVPAVFGEPARAITRNIIVIATGFTPLLLAPLTPYKTVGVLLATILLVSGLTTLLILPALVRVLEKRLFPVERKQPVGVTCNCVVCIISSITAVVLLAMSLSQHWQVGWTTLTWVSLIAVPVLALSCGVLSRRRACQVRPTDIGETA